MNAPLDLARRTSVHVPATPASVLWGRLPSARDEPVQIVGSGSLVSLDTISHEGALPDQGGDPAAFFRRHGIDDILPDLVECAAALPRDAAADGPHFVTGPVAVTGARPGDLLRVDIVSLRRRCDYGVVSDRHHKDVFAAEPGTRPFAASQDLAYAVVHVDAAGDREFARMDGFPAVELRPFLGIIGVAPAGNERLHSGPPGNFGGNLDLAYLVEGSTLFLPVQVEGALFYVGDPHFVQGNGELASTALEAPLTVTVRLTVLPGAADRHPDAPVALAGDNVVVCGLDRDLGRAVRLATANTLTLLEKCGRAPQQSLLWLSMAGEVEVTQVVDGVLGAHVVCPAEAFEPVIADWAAADADSLPDPSHT
ncbi:acetamidase [Rhodococcus sp. IEGM 248]|nr:acetamidase [Rhodococcus sp. IEGM 248]